MSIRSTTQTHSDHPFAGTRAVLFDLDGTLVESAIDFRRMRVEIARLAADHGLSPEEFAAPDVLGMVRAAAARLPDPRVFLARAEETMVAIEMAALPGAREIPGARDLLRSLASAGLAVGIVTRNCRAAASPLIAAFALQHGVVLTRDDVPRVKPHPEHLLIAARRLGVPAHATMMVGDHPMDVQGGRAAGMRTVGFLGPDRPESVFAAAPPDAVIRHLSEIAAWISPF
ncbi:MAG: HAD family hydrolase [Armatimonadetes bacterium]|nr:HAD family hydrolase [Armatimonadota bacterium]